MATVHPNYSGSLCVVILEDPKGEYFFVQHVNPKEITSYWRSFVTSEDAFRERYDNVNRNAMRRITRAVHLLNLKKRLDLENLLASPETNVFSLIPSDNGWKSWEKDKDHVLERLRE